MHQKVIIYKPSTQSVTSYYLSEALSQARKIATQKHVWNKMKISNINEPTILGNLTSDDQIQTFW